MSIRIALAGNPNCGKTTLFNALTGSNQYVGNWPGVTVEKKEGNLKGHDGVIITDLPGIYSLSPYTLDEVVARKYLVEERPDVILNIVDGTNIERNLYLTTQLMELGIPVVVAINMMDIVVKNGNRLDTAGLEKNLHCKVSEISALKGTGIEKATELAINEAKNKALRPQHIFSGEVEHAIAHIEEAAIHNLPEEQQRWYAIKIFERDQKVIEKLKIDNNTVKHIEQDIKIVETIMDDDAESIITNERYSYIAEILKDCYKKKHAGYLSTSDKIDRIVTNRFLGLPLFVLIMFIVYYIAISKVGAAATDWTNNVLFGTWIKHGVEVLLNNIGATGWVVSLVKEGVLGGLAAPISFAPQMAIVFFFLSILEDCGYMSRVAFIMDKLFRNFGLSGKSFIPLLISSGCGVPGIMACRTIETEKDRRLTMITTTAIPCSAKLPVIALISAYLANGAWWIAPIVYFVAIGVVVVSCTILKKTKQFDGETSPFVMELPQYHVPSLFSVLLHVWDRIWSFLKKAGTVLFVCCTIMWVLSNFGIKNGSFGLYGQAHSLFAVAGSAIAFIFKPLGFGNWQSVAATLAGIVAKEGIVSTMGVLSTKTLFSSSIAAVSFLFFNLFNSPCIAAITTLAREIGSKKYFWLAIAYQNISAYCFSLMVYQIVGLIIGQVTFNIFTIIAFALLCFLLYLIFKNDSQHNKVRSHA